jgi:SAM-dependent methyltransferase
VQVTTDTEARDVLLRHRRVWEQKPVLRRIYNEEFFARLLSSRAPGGISIEIGGGPGFFKQLFPEVISTDLIPCPWLDVVADAQVLPFKTSSLTNVLGLDVLHHLAAPMKFLKEAERVLAPGGRLVLVEPWITPFSYLIYHYLHQEECDFSVRPWEAKDGQTPQAKKALDGNPAIPYLMFRAENRQKTLAALPGLTCLAAEPFCLFAYLLSFGFKSMNLLPEKLYPAVSMLERNTIGLWRRLASLRVLLVLEKSVPGAGESRAN